MSQSIRVLVADDDPVIRVGVRAMLKSAGVDVVGEATDGREAVTQARALAPDVILMDMMMPGMDGAEASREILAHHRSARIVALTSLEADERVLAAIRAGVQGYVHKTASQEELVRAVRDVHRGELVLPAALTHKFLVASPAQPLTRVEAALQAAREDWGMLRTKLYRPDVAPDLVARAELLARLDAGRRLPLTLVSAPAGYGKTTLVSHWLESRGEPSAWLSLDETDSDTMVFLRYFVAAVSTLFPAACEDTAALLGASETPPGPVLARSLANDLAAIGESFLLVLDDYHLVGEPAVHEIVDDLLKHPPHGFHLAILTRRDPPLALASLRARHQMTELRLRDLQFGRRQTVDFLHKALGLSLSDVTLTRLQDSTEGWPVGLRLAVLALRHGSGVDELVRGFGGDSRQVQDYLVTEILAHQPPALREVLCRASVLERFCASLCEAVCGAVTSLRSPQAESFEHLLEGAGLLSIPLDDRHEWYRFHHLFHELLRRQLEARSSVEERAELHRRACAWFERKGFVEDAIRHALAGGDTVSAVRLVERNGDEAMNREQWARLDRWLGMLPAAILDTNPRLLVLRALCLCQHYRYKEMYDVLDQAESLLPAEPEPRDAGLELRGGIDVLRSHRRYTAAEGELAVVYAERALALLPPEAQSVRGHAMALLGVSLQMVGELDRARQSLFDALGDRSLPSGSFRSRVLVTLCWVDWMAGDLASLGQSALRLSRCSEELELAESRDYGRYFLGVCHYQRNELSEAEGHLVPLVAEPFLTRTTLYVHGAFALALTRLAQGRPDEARELGEAVVAHLMEAGNAYVVPMAKAFLAELDLRQGHMARAAHWAANGVTGPLLPMYMFYVPELTRVKVWIAQGEPSSLARAAESLERLGEYVDRTNNRRFLIDVLATEALLHDASGDEPAAVETLERALYLALPGGLVRVFADLGPRLAKLLHRSKLDEEGLRYVGEILAAFRGGGTDDMKQPASAADPADLSGGFDALPEPLTKRETEVLALIARRLTNKEIAAELGISPATVKRHTHNVYDKLRVSGRREVVAKAVGLGLLSGS